MLRLIFQWMNGEREHIYMLFSHILHSDCCLLALHQLNAENTLSDYLLTSPKDDEFI